MIVSCSETFFVLSWIKDTGEKWKFENMFVKVNKQPFKNLVLSDELIKVELPP